GQLLMAHTGKIAPLDKKTFTLELAERFGSVLDALGKPSNNVPFMMPARIASTPADEQIKEFVGSGPFKFAREEWQPGEQVAYVRAPVRLAPPRAAPLSEALVRSALRRDANSRSTRERSASRRTARSKLADLSTARMSPMDWFFMSAPRLAPTRTT